MAVKPFRWAVAFIDQSTIHYLSSDLRKHPKYQDVEPFIPMVQVLKKKLKGKNHFENIPLLFNYGFFKVPKYFIPNSNYLDEMKKDVQCIYQWMIDPISARVGRSYDPVTGWMSNPKGVALASKSEIKTLQAQEKLKSIYSARDVDTLEQGKIITLKLYPFDGLPARIVTVDRKKKKVWVMIIMDTPMADKPIEVDFDNIFYSAYENYMDLEMREESTDKIKLKFKNFEGQNDEREF